MFSPYGPWEHGCWVGANNDAERRLRRAVLWRCRSFGAQSEDGSRFVERVLTAVTTLRQQKRDVLDYLTQACAAAILGDKVPSLLPAAWFHRPTERLRFFHITRPCRAGLRPARHIIVPSPRRACFNFTNTY
jgi:hypothetical protein